MRNERRDNLCQERRCSWKRSLQDRSSSGAWEVVSPLGGLACGQTVQTGLPDVVRMLVGASMCLNTIV